MTIIGASEYCGAKGAMIEWSQTACNRSLPRGKTRCRRQGPKRRRFSFGRAPIDKMEGRDSCQTDLLKRRRRILNRR